MKSLMNTRYGRDDRIRTCGLCVPNATLYQAEPHPGGKEYDSTIRRVFQVRISKIIYLFQNYLILIIFGTIFNIFRRFGSKIHSGSISAAKKPAYYRKILLKSLKIEKSVPKTSIFSMLWNTMKKIADSAMRLPEIRKHHLDKAPQ